MLAYQLFVELMLHSQVPFSLGTIFLEFIAEWMSVTLKVTLNWLTHTINSSIIKTVYNVCSKLRMFDYFI